MTVRTKFLGLCTSVALAVLMASPLLAVGKPDPATKPSGDKNGPPAGHHPVVSVAGVIQGARTLPPPTAPTIVLYDQTDNQGINAFNSQNFEAAYNAYDDMAADDFVVSGAGWNVTTVVTPGVYFNGSGPASSLHVTFYDDDGTGLPGAAVCDYPVVNTFTDAAGSFTTTLSPACGLTPGPKWVSVVANMDFAVGGQWGWAMRTTINFNPAAWQNPGGGFGSPCTSWGSRAFLCATDTLDEPDQVFRLDGSFASCNNNADCQDGNLCNGSEVCVANVCQPGTPVNCDDGLFCTVDTCAPATGACSHAPNPCSDGDSCTLDGCNEATDTCTHFSPPIIHRCNAGAIGIPDVGNGSPYPSVINVAGLPSTGGVCSVELNGITHTFPSDIDMLLVAPGTSNNAIIMSDAGGGSGITGVNVVLKDTAAGPIPTPIVNGTYQPTNIGAGDGFPAPAPIPTGGSALSAFDNTNPNGNWQLFLVDDAGGDSGSVANGWCINLIVGACSQDSECNDGNACNGVETCIAGQCAAGTPVNCDDGLFCTIDTCAPATGACSHAPNPCHDTDACTTDSCDEAGDQCVHIANSIRLCNGTSITILDASPASPYPSSIVASGLPTNGSVCSVELRGLSHTFPDDIDILLARDSGPNAMIMSDVGGGTDAVNVDLTLTDSAASAMPDAGPLVSGTFRPTDIGTPDAAFPAPAPPISGGSALSTFDGQNPNGNWNLWVRDEFAADTGTISGGWCINLVVTSCSSDADCQDSNLCNGTETCVGGNCQPGTPVNCDDGLFCTTDSCTPATGACTHAPNPCADADGCTIDTCDEATHSCNHTSACVRVCNSTTILINDTPTPPTAATPYPSPINVSGASGSFTLVSVELKGLSHTFPDDIDILLAAPNVANGAIIMSDVGGSADATNVDITLTDGAPLIPDAGPLVSGTFSPTNVSPGTGTETFPAPAPVPSASSALSQFNGSNPNGDWKLFVVDDEATDSGSISGGWCINYISGCASNDDCNDGNVCNGVETCVAGQCVAGTPLSCDDGNACNGAETCNPASGCVAGTPLNCNDGNPCNGVETCSPASGCVPGTPLNCDDGNACNGAETCSPASGCVPGTPLVCNDGNACNGVETCNPASGCVAGTPPTCNDGNACNGVETCNPATGCVPGTPLNCNDGNACNGVETCNPASGCVAGTPLNCNDGNACNGVETCNPASGCVAGTPLNCDDGNACNGVETCNPASGCVAGTPVTCGPPDQCHTAGVCDPGSGLCGYGNQPDGTACDDGNAATSGDACQGGVCVGGNTCNSTNDPKTRGWYKKLCHGDHSGDSLTDADAACVAAMGQTFAGISTVAQICEVFDRSNGPNYNTCQRTEDQLMTLFLNVCKQRVCPVQGIDSTCGSNTTVAQSLAQSDAIFGNPARTTDQCLQAECLDKEINSGHALELNTLAVRRELTNIRLSWLAPILDDGTGNPRGYKIWRRAMGSTAPFVQIGTTTGATTYLDTGATTGSWQYDVTPYF